MIKGASHLGQSEWYYLDPRGTDRFADMQEINVPSENSPNPYAKEIQNYLYENDEVKTRNLKFIRSKLS